jgi:hypothetical protein
VRRLSARLGVALTVVALAATACSSARHPGESSGQLMARIRTLTPATSVVSGPPEQQAAGVARSLLVTAPVVVVASQSANLNLAAARAEHAHAPLLLTAARGRSTALRTEVLALHPSAVLAIGVSQHALAAQLPGISVVTDPRDLPKTSAPAPLRHVVLLVHRGGPASPAVAATASVAGAQVVRVSGYDPRADPHAIRLLAADRPTQVVAVGARFGPARRLAARVAVAVTGVQLPGGGERLFPGHRLVALYGHPGTPGLGALGEQDLSASIARIKRVAALYRPLSRGIPVVPTFEIIATVAQGADAPGPQGTYSYETPVSMLRPWIRAATAAHMYVVLDLQPGRANLLTQAKKYRSLLLHPNVGLALDPEWKLQPGQMPLQQIGGVSITEVNSVVNWLAGLTASHHLPQKLLVLHQFRLSMIQNEARLNTHHDDLAIVIHMDGQGTPGEKEQTWNAVLGAAPHGVFFGWKNFYTKDHPMLTPDETMDRHPQPVMISYQ